MQVTSFEVSKKLAEIGFVAKTDYYWLKFVEREVPTLFNKLDPLANCVEDDGDIYAEAHSLETILENLPSTLEMRLPVYTKKGLRFKKEIVCLVVNKHSVRLAEELSFEKQENETLADAAGRLLLLLHEKGLFKIN